MYPLPLNVIVDKAVTATTLDGHEEVVLFIVVENDVLLLPPVSSTLILLHHLHINNPEDNVYNMSLTPISSLPPFPSPVTTLSLFLPPLNVLLF